MSSKKIFLGNNVLHQQPKNVEGLFVEIDNEKFYKIANVNGMPDFFMTIVSDSDHWMYLSSNGALSAGRKNRDNALFPYYTVDKIHDYKGKTGSKTICRITKNNKIFLWEPFTSESESVYLIERNLYKSIYGNKILFEERNIDLGLAFRYEWCNSEKFGWIKKSELSNFGDENIEIDILDGLINLLPHGVDYVFQNEYSNLLDAYKKNELIAEAGLGLFMLSSIPVDRAEPSEALKTTTVWSSEINTSTKYLLSEKQLTAFRAGEDINTETDIRAARGAYFINAQLHLKRLEKSDWLFAAEINQDSADVGNLIRFLKSPATTKQLVLDDIKKGTKSLIKIVAAADGLQTGNEDLPCARHFSNTLFNVMRGGIFSDNYRVQTTDFKRYVYQCNKTLATSFAAEISKLPEAINYNELVDWAAGQNNSDLERIAFEYLPLTFSRRHGDPSRPWNVFSIETKNADGSNKLNYQGNWRDIFQNWEALALSYPGFLPGMIFKFLNATTADGYNPYRITREGIDWEVPNPNEPWAFIGYWGDHQIIYLLKLFEHWNAHFPGEIEKFFASDLFVYANVPYRIKSFEKILKDPKNTIDFDFDLNIKLTDEAAKIGADGKLLASENEIYHVNLGEKILVTLLAKLSNFIPEAGIWMNTQRPEWNDANNALVGNGVSMVTLYYIRRFISFWKEIFENISLPEIEISEEVKSLFDEINRIFIENMNLLKTGFSDADRYSVTCELGEAGSSYREKIYAHSFSKNKTSISSSRILGFFDIALQYIDQSIQKNKRDDGLFHAYNLVSIQNKKIPVRYLYEMLEGQVAVLSSGFLNASESLKVLDSLKSSRLFRKDQYSYILYPDRQLPRFTEKNIVPDNFVKTSKLLQKLLDTNNTSVIKIDENGKVYFNGNFRNATYLSAALGQLDPKTYGTLVEHEKETILDVYELMFDHQSFTGRSGTFYGYEGLGSIYWHMVSKLLLATQESFFKAIDENAGSEIQGRLKAHYYEIKAGIGLYKSPQLYGAFPTDAYSHTPGGAGAKQPGLTGQVKEDIIARLGELGVRITNGRIIFDTALLNHNEILGRPEMFSFHNLKGDENEIQLSENQLVFTFCQIPVLLNFSHESCIKIHYTDKKIRKINGSKIENSLSNEIFKRSGDIEKIEVSIINQKK